MVILKNSNYENDIAELKVFFAFLRESARTSILSRAMEADLDAIASVRSEKKLRQLTKEMKELVRETFSPNQANDFDSFLRANGIQSKRPNQAEMVNKILDRGKLKNRSEFEVLSSYVNAVLSGLNR
jgi:Ca2+-binding EF-hand superfamily protein